MYGRYNWKFLEMASGKTEVLEINISWSYTGFFSPCHSIDGIKGYAHFLVKGIVCIIIAKKMAPFNSNAKIDSTYFDHFSLNQDQLLILT